MKTRLVLAIVMGVTAMPVLAADYGPIQQVGGCSACGTPVPFGPGLRHLDPTPRATFGQPHRCDWQDCQRARSDRIQRLVEFILYRPTIPCDCLPRPAAHVPPLQAWFPNTCSSNAAECCTPSARRCQRRVTGCATCACSVGTPVNSHVAQYQPATTPIQPPAKAQPAPANNAMTPMMPRPNMTPYKPLDGMKPLISAPAQPQPRVHTTMSRPTTQQYDAALGTPRAAVRPSNYYGYPAGPVAVPQTPYGVPGQHGYGQPVAYPQR